MSLGLIATTFKSVASPPIIIDPLTNQYDLANHMEMYLTKDKNTTLEKVSSPNFAKFVPYNSALQRSPKNYSSILWIRFTVVNPTAKDAELFLTREVPNVYTKWAIYTRNPHGSFTEIKIPAKTNQNDTVPLTIQDHSTQEYYMTNYSSGWLITSFILTKSYPFLMSQITLYFILGIQYGIVIALLTHSCFIYSFLRDKRYLLYILLILAGLFLFILFNGLLNALPNIEVSSEFYLKAVRFDLLVISVLYLLFTKEILNFKQYVPRLNRFIFYYCFLTIPLTILTFIPNFGYYQIEFLKIQANATYILITFILCVVGGIVVFFTGFKPAKYYMAGMISLTLAILCHWLTALGFLPYNMLTLQAAPLGLDIDMILQSIALAVRFSLIQQSEIAAQQIIIEQTNRISRLQQSALKTKQHLIDAYTRFFPKKFLELLRVKSVTQIKLGDHVESTMTVLFADLRNFTTTLEKKTSEESFYFINNYLHQIGPLIRKYNGYIDKYIGDAILALFDQTPEHAIATAIEIVNILNNIQKNFPEYKLKMGIGIHYGSLMVGTIGEEERMDGTVISDTVNVASRIENLNKIYGTQILISTHVLQQLKNKKQFKLRFVDHIFLKGKQFDTTLYEVFDNDPPEIIEKKLQLEHEYNTAIQYYQQQEFDKALTMFQHGQMSLPQDKLIALYIKRCEAGQKRGQLQDWKPIVKLTEKIVME